MKKYLLLTPILFILFACAAQPQPTADVGQIVSATLTAVAQSNPQKGQPPEAQSTSQEAQATDVQPNLQLSIKPQDPNLPAGSDHFPAMGTIAGSLSYPSSFIPPMRVVFFSLQDGFPSYTDTAPGQGTFSIDLPEGQYHVVAYPFNGDANSAGSTYGGGYTQAVPCGLSIDCTDHSLIPVTVVAGQTVTADPGDWYAPPDTFPPMPAP